ncbi:MAG: sigma-54-dependent Fis family transcriptional regulator [Myxococcales bacterium]|nr:sigma-54-dependent Fis family transcriptional regulator [Myxococcales bacterium]
MAAALRKEGHAVKAFTSPEAALEHIASEVVDVVVSDVSMAGMDGVELCERARQVQPDVPVVLVTGQGSLEVAIRALRAEAFDFVLKPVDINELAPRLQRAIEHRGLKREIDRLQRETVSIAPVANIVGNSPAMRRVYELVRRVGGSEASVLISGETGTGKELVARAIHGESPRRNGPFVAINCAAVPANLIESQLFGHARGAFTDAKEAKRGLFVEANGGTLFLDEIGEMPIEVQPKLLRALQERKVRPLGSNDEIPFDTRIVSATNRDLETEVLEKRFREDLFYRLNVVAINLPPLRARGPDVLAVAALVLKKLAPKRTIKITSEAAQKLMAYDWPGNVRELENCMERAIALSRVDEIVVDDLPDKVRNFVAQNIVISAEHTDELVTVEELERRYIQKVLKQVGGNKSRAAEVLGVDRRTLYRKLDALK